MSSADTYLAGPFPHILAHRGFHMDFPENSLGAFQAALERGATHLETDVHVSSDGSPMLFHDPTALVEGRVRKVGSLTLDQLRAHRPDLQIATLDEALKTFPHARFNIDVKERSAVSPVLDVVRSNSAWDRVLLASFDERTRRDLAKAAPQAIMSASRQLVVSAWVLSICGLIRWMRRVLSDVVAMQIPEKFGPIRIVTPRFIRHCRLAGVTLHVWTVNEFSDMKRLIELGVDGIVTDRCDRASRLTS